ncbi:MAG: MerR family transcriptional regulator [Myxococcota bacterium]|nr:MerR family transcriptional regulator [Myxococcota bacterium]
MAAEARAIDHDAGRYRIGTVAQLTGLSPDTIRAWERRYETVAPLRSEGGTRMYSESDVARLQLMRALTDCGEQIGSIAPLENDALRARLARHARGAAPEPVEPSSEPKRATTLAVLDPLLSVQLQANPAELIDLELVVARDTLEGFIDALGETRADVLVLDLPTLGESPRRAIERCVAESGAEAVVVLYDFAPRRRLTKLAAMGVRLVKGPVRTAMLRRRVLDFLAINRAAEREEPLALEVHDERQPPAPRAFDDKQLAQLREMRSSVDCECPNHISALVTSLVAFERYCANCAVESPEDAEFHGMLERRTSHARSMMEKLLTRLCEHDGLRI